MSNILVPVFEAQPEQRTAPAHPAQRTDRAAPANAPLKSALKSRRQSRQAAPEKHILTRQSRATDHVNKLVGKKPTKLKPHGRKSGVPVSEIPLYFRDLSSREEDWEGKHLLSSKLLKQAERHDKECVIREVRMRNKLIKKDEDGNEYVKATGQLNDHRRKKYRREMKEALAKHKTDYEVIWSQHHVSRAQMDQAKQAQIDEMRKNEPAGADDDDDTSDEDMEDGDTSDEEWTDVDDD